MLENQKITRYSPSSDSNRRTPLPRPSTGKKTVFTARAPITTVDPREGDHYVLWFEEPRIARSARPGQFVTLLLPDSRMMLRRPFSIHRIAGTRIGVLVKVVGSGTRSFRECAPGDLLDVAGPVGNGFDLDRSAAPAIIVTGGTGTALLVFLAERLVQQGRHVEAFAGFDFAVPFEMSPDVDGNNQLVDLAEIGAASRVSTMTARDGCHKGLVTELLERRIADIEASADSSASDAQAEVFACGPRPMLKKVAEITADAGLNCQVSMEERMACGIGACGGCACKVMVEGEQVFKRVCFDGPVFNASDVIW